MTLFLEKNDDVYVPNVFSPNGDNINDALLISAGSDVEEILEFVVLDRWGNVVYADDHFEANDVMHVWDGRMKGKELNPGVFAFMIILKYANGTTDSMYGDVTILK